ncbi:MAG: flagellar export chaperone FliS [Phycisphaeraceae bacterium]|nr:MAG: flagellar export chaperone FliS [Phycisphaeraceae bacterium]
MSADKANAYLRTKVMTASPAELRLLLIEGAIKFSRQGRDGLAEKDYEACYNGLSQAKSILLELMSSLRPEIDPELCSQLSSLYTFMYRRLLDAMMEKKPEIVDEVVSLLEYDRETWVLLMQKLAREQASTPGRPIEPTSANDAIPAPGARPDEAPTRMPLSIEG